MPVIPAINIRSYDGVSSYDIYSLLLKERIIMLTGEVTDQLSEIIVAELLYLDAEDPDSPITVYINSPGGSVTAGMAIYDIMQHLKCPVRTIAVGLAASMGAFLLATGTKGYRMAYPNAEIMIHQPLGQTSGQVSDLKIMTERFINIKSRLNKILAEKTGKNIAEVEKDTDRDNFLSAQQALDYGLIDEIVDGTKLSSTTTA